GASPSVSSRFLKTFYRWARDRFTRRCTGWSSADGSARSGARLTTTAAPSFIRLPAPAAINWKKRWASGKSSPLRLPWYCSKTEADMRWLKSITALFSKRKLETDLDDEVRFHLEKQIELNRAAGMSAEEARRQALIEFGGIEQTREAVRATRWAHG